MGPYKCLGEPDTCTFVYYTPKQSIKALKTGRVIAAPVPVAALPELLGTIEYLGEYGIAAEKEVQSVLLFSNKPFHTLDRNTTIFLTNQSASSISLLYVLLANRRDVKTLPVFTFQDNNPDAALYIGDQALLLAMNHSFKYVTDLASKWYTDYSLPFVFARWVVNKNVPCELKSILNTWLVQLKKMDSELVERAAPKEAKRLGISEEQMRAYFNGIQRVLKEKHIKGQELFLKKIGHPDIADRITGLIKFHIHLDTKNKRMTRNEALELLTKERLGSLMDRAFKKRNQLYPDNLITFVKDTNPNYTNVCETKCSFCAFHRSGSDQEAYTLSPEELAEKIKRSENAGATTVLLQGGHNPALGFDDWIAYIRAIKKTCPAIHIHPFSPSEICYMSKKEHLYIQEILQALKMEGIRTIPGGGGEILVDSIRKKISPGKCSADQWLDVMEQAHLMGYKTTATMMYGHIETPEDCVDHLLRLREVQDKTGGFTSFIPWSFKPGNSPLTKSVSFPVHAACYIRIIAVARLVLDNFDHIQSSWFSESDNAGQLGLLAGADDFGGILIEENVLATSGYIKQTSLNKVKSIIRDCQFTPALRDSFYNIIEIYNDD